MHKMKIFNLPDLGEGLVDAVLREWYVKEGDYVEIDQPIASMETAKAIVDIPASESGYIFKQYAKPNDIVNTGEPLVSFSESPLSAFDSSTQEHVIHTDHEKTSHSEVQDREPLQGTRRTMAINMAKSQTSGMLPAVLYEDADIHTWRNTEDYTLRLIRALIKACQTEPSLNAHYFNHNLSRRLWDPIHLGIAMDSSTGLYVPVLKDIAHTKPCDLRKQINAFKQQAEAQSFSPESLAEASIILSNFGSIGTGSGRYAIPVMIPPIVAIIATGSARDQVVACEGKVEIHKTIPITLAFDHRAVTGGEAARFLMALIADLNLQT